jgi:hypothetical protein
MITPAKLILTINLLIIEQRNLLLKPYFFVEKIDYMLQRRIVKELGNETDTTDALYTKYAITGFHFIAWMVIFVNVTI